MVDVYVQGKRKGLRRAIFLFIYSGAILPGLRPHQLLKVLFPTPQLCSRHYLQPRFKMSRKKKNVKAILAQLRKEQMKNHLCVPTW